MRSSRAVGLAKIKSLENESLDERGHWTEYCWTYLWHWLCHWHWFCHQLLLSPNWTCKLKWLAVYIEASHDDTMKNCFIDLHWIVLSQWSGTNCLIDINQPTLFWLTKTSLKKKKKKKKQKSEEHFFTKNKITYGLLSHFHNILQSSHPHPHPHPTHPTKKKEKEKKKSSVMMLCSISWIFLTRVIVCESPWTYIGIFVWYKKFVATIDQQNIQLDKGQFSRWNHFCEKHKN